MPLTIASMSLLRADNLSNHFVTMHAFPNPLFLFALLSISLVRATPTPAILPTTDRLSGGTDLQLRDAPFTVMLSTGDMFCSGSIISSRWVLLAGHCDLLTGAKAVIADGKRTVLRVVRHPDFRLASVTIHNDIALAELDRPIGRKAKSVKLSKNKKIPWEGQTVFAFGFGAKNNAFQQSRKLRRAGMTALALKSCRKMMHPKLAKSIDYKMHVCVNEWIKKAGICAGDSGGPLVAGNVQIGIASYRLGECGNTKKPDVFTRVQPYIKWIEKVVGHTLA